MDEDFEWRVELATGMTYQDVLILGQAQEAEQQRRIQAAGYCCEAGAVAHPCPWHPASDQPDSGRPGSGD